MNYMVVRCDPFYIFMVLPWSFGSRQVAKNVIRWEEKCSEDKERVEVRREQGSGLLVETVQLMIIKMVSVRGAGLWQLSAFCQVTVKGGTRCCYKAGTSMPTHNKWLLTGILCLLGGVISDLDQLFLSLQLSCLFRNRSALPLSKVLPANDFISMIKCLYRTTRAIAREG